MFTGFPTGLRMNQPSVVGQYQAGRGVLANNIMLAPRTAYAAGSGVAVADVQAIWEATNTMVNEPASAAQYTALGLNPAEQFFGSRLPNSYGSNPNFAVTTGTLTSGASFSNAKFNEPNRTGFFQDVPFIGGFGATDWTNGWAEFDPVDKAY